ncbi:peptidoglycan DD-metalloendopeptidase family protein [Parvibaculum sp.]|uniref:peptidoglycan DD-metalloendopeptidase family protein n=1 Tax=Parvibaculum sp. TaxID=2024848 RepID=UPI0032109C70
MRAVRIWLGVWRMRGVHHRNSGFGEALRRFLRHHYVERQIYLRSHGQVQFISLSPFTQAVFLAIAFVFFSWIAFTSVNVIFKQQIIASKEQRYLRMQSAYEERVAQLQAAYDQLNGQLVISQERFLATTRELEDRHRQLTTLMSQSQSASSELEAMRRRYAATTRPSPSEARENTILMSVDHDTELAASGASLGQTTTRPQKNADAETYVVDGAPSGSVDMSGLAGNAPQNGTASQIDARLAQLDRGQQGFINSIEETTDRKIKELRSIIAMTDVAAGGDLSKGSAMHAAEAEGGPFLGLAEGEALAGAGEDQAFAKQLHRVSQNLNTVADLESFIAKIPLAEPVAGYHETSGFGPRVDPFNGRMAFHAGEDLATDYGAPVYATTAGTVTFADWRGAYGRLVELDLGNGFRTRYGHLSRIDVRVGQKIAFRDRIGRVGSSGRSSGPHLHYEVWFDGIVRDPSKFIEAGHYVFEKQG